MIIGAKDKARVAALEKKCDDLNTELREVVFDNIILTKEVTALRIAVNQMRAGRTEEKHD